MALLVALLALWKSHRDLRRERRIAHELELLRDLVDQTESDEGEWKRAWRIRTTLLMLPGSADLPMSRAALEARATPEAESEFQRQFGQRAMRAAEESGFVGVESLHVDVWLKFEALPDQLVRAEIEQAVRRRVGAASGTPRWLARFRGRASAMDAVEPLSPTSER